MPGSSKEQVLSRLPADCTSVMLHFEKIGKLGRGYGHATCLRQEQGTWYHRWHVDSENSGPEALKGSADWAQLYGNGMAFPP